MTPQQLKKWLRNSVAAGVIISAAALPAMPAMGSTGHASAHNSAGMHAALSVRYVKASHVTRASMVLKNTSGYATAYPNATLKFPGRAIIAHNPSGVNVASGRGWSSFSKASLSAGHTWRVTVDLAGRVPGNYKVTVVDGGNGHQSSASARLS